VEKTGNRNLVVGGLMAFTHGMSKCWCKLCCVEAQLKHALEIARKITEFEKELKELKDRDENN
jgi:hypothetical protein